MYSIILYLISFYELLCSYFKGNNTHIDNLRYNNRRKYELDYTVFGHIDQNPLYMDDPTIEIDFNRIVDEWDPITLQPISSNKSKEDLWQETVKSLDLIFTKIYFSDDENQLDSLFNSILKPVIIDLLNEWIENKIIISSPAHMFCSRWYTRPFYTTNTFGTKL